MRGKSCHHYNKEKKYAYSDIDFIFFSCLQQLSREKCTVRTEKKNLRGRKKNIEFSDQGKLVKKKFCLLFFFFLDE